MWIYQLALVYGVCVVGYKRAFGSDTVPFVNYEDLELCYY